MTGSVSVQHGVAICSMSTLILCVHYEERVKSWGETLVFIVMINYINTQYFGMLQDNWPHLYSIDFGLIPCFVNRIYKHEAAQLVITWFHKKKYWTRNNSRSHRYRPVNTDNSTHRECQRLSAELNAERLSAGRRQTPARAEAAGSVPWMIHCLTRWFHLQHTSRFYTFTVFRGASCWQDENKD